MMQPPPSNTQAEAAIIGACITSPKLINDISSVLSSEDFYLEAHLEIFEACCKLGDKTDLITVIDYLTKKRLLEKCGGQDRIIDIATEAPPSASWKYWVDIIRELSNRRRLIAECQNTITRAVEQTNDLSDLFIEHEKAIQDIEQGSPQRIKQGIHLSNIYTPEKLISSYQGYVKKLQDNQLLTGVTRIDEIIRGVGGGEVLFIIARPGCFKTASLQNILLNYVNQTSNGAVFFSLEMPVPSVAERYHSIINQCVGREVQGLYTHSTEEEKKDRLEREFINKMQRLFVVPSKISPSDIPAYINLIKLNYNINIGAIGIDYLGLLSQEGKEYEATTKLAREMKDTAKLLDIPVVVLSQTSRKAGSGDIELDLTMGRGSGAIEENADFLLGIWKNKSEYVGEDDEVICKILKNRKGYAGSCWKLAMDTKTLRLGSECNEWVAPAKTKKFTYGSV